MQQSELLAEYRKFPIMRWSRDYLEEFTEILNMNQIENSEGYTLHFEIQEPVMGEVMWSITLTKDDDEDYSN